MIYPCLYLGAVSWLSVFHPGVWVTHGSPWRQERKPSWQFNLVRGISPVDPFRDSENSTPTTILPSVTHTSSVKWHIVKLFFYLFSFLGDRAFRSKPAEKYGTAWRWYSAHKGTWTADRYSHCFKSYNLSITDALLPPSSTFKIKLKKLERVSKIKTRHSGPQW